MSLKKQVSKAKKTLSSLLGRLLSPLRSVAEYLSSPSAAVSGYFMFKKGSVTINFVYPKVGLSFGRSWAASWTSSASKRTLVKQVSQTRKSER